jgi:hypothetical protein
MFEKQGIERFVAARHIYPYRPYTVDLSYRFNKLTRAKKNFSEHGQICFDFAARKRYTHFHNIFLKPLETASATRMRMQS